MPSSGLAASTGAVGRHGRMEGARFPAFAFLPQHFKDCNSLHLTDTAVNTKTDHWGRQYLQPKASTAAKDPAKLAKMMESLPAFEAAQRDCLLKMAEEGLVTMETISKWEMFWPAWQRLAEYFTTRNICCNWGGFLAANNRAWLTMYVARPATRC